MNAVIYETSFTDTIQYTLNSGSPIVPHTEGKRAKPLSKISDQDVLAISGLLQTTLDQSKIIECFTQEILRFVQVDHISFQAINREVVIGAAYTGQYRSVFPVRVDDTTLGTICFDRSSAFTAKENKSLKQLLGALAYPIRNALLYKQAIEAATKDPLTGVGNRAAMDASIAREIDLATRHNQPLCLLTIDIDHFKNVNDTYGHSTGDCVIKAVTEAATLAMRTSDMIFRYGGEEFVIILSNTAAIGAMLMAERLRKQIEETSIVCDGHEIFSTVSIGLSTLEDQDDAANLFSRADAALYEAKSSGRNCCKANLNL